MYNIKLNHAGGNLKKVSKKSRKRISPMKGRKISNENRGNHAPKLGRRFMFKDGSETKTISLTLPKGVFEYLAEKYATDSVSGSIREALMEVVES